MKSRKAQHITMPVVIGFIIGLVLLIVVVYIFADRTILFNQNAGKSCEKTNGICLEDEESCPDDKPNKIFLHCEAKKKITACCIESILEG